MRQKSTGFPLNPAQKAAAEAPKTPLLIVAGAGTGKTKTLTSRIIYLIQAGTPPERICAITFTNKAAKEMADRVMGQLGQANRIGAANRTGGSGDKRPLIATFHALGARILRKECRLAERDPNFVIFDDHDSFDLVKKATKAVLPPKASKKDDGLTPAERKRAEKKEGPAFFATEISKIKNVHGRLEELEGEVRENPAAKESIKAAAILGVFKKYEDALKRNNAFDFDDLIEKPVAIFQKHPAVLAKYQNMFDAILVDEYQDINPKQYELVEMLAREHRNLSVVGDDEQTIYSWRYADIRTFLDFEKKWKGAKIYFLEENYRSTHNIIRAASEVAKNNRFRAPKNLWTNNPKGEHIVLYEAWGENEEAEWIATVIQRLRAVDRKKETGGHNGHAVASDGASHRSSIAILYRTNAQSRALEQALIRNNIPYKIFGGLKFYERLEIKDAVAALRYICNTKDELARERLEKNLTKRAFAEFADKVRSANKFGNNDAAASIKPLDAIKLFLESFAYFEHLEANFINAEEREDNLVELISFAGGFATLPELLERLSLLQAIDDEQGGGKNGVANANGGTGSAKRASGDEVSLMTIHLAKGLEFDSVFIAGAAEGLLPHGRSLDDENSLEEERRLMYVAMTRARKNLFISFFGIPSRFVSEIPEEHISLAGEPAGGESSTGTGISAGASAGFFGDSADDADSDIRDTGSDDGEKIISLD